MSNHILESRIEREATAYAIARGWWECKIIQASKNGIPDRLYIRDGVTLFVEYKRPGELPRPQQEKRMAELRAKGVHAVWVDSVERAKELLK